MEPRGGKFVRVYIKHMLILGVNYINSQMDLSTFLDHKKIAWVWVFEKIIYYSLGPYEVEFLASPCVHLQLYYVRT